MGNHHSDVQQFGKFKILLESSVQKIDESGLFDSDAKSRWTDHPLQEGLFVRDDSKVSFIVNGNKRTHSQQIKLASITCSDRLLIHNVTQEGGLWFVIQKQYKIQIGDTLKFGRFRVRAVEMNGKKMEVQNCYNALDLKCRYCLKESSEAVITPCNCKQGIYSQLHISCYKQWFQKTYTPFEYKNVQFYQWKKLECEHCKKHFAYNFTVDQIEHSLIELPKPPYLMLQLISRDSNQMKGMYIIRGEVKVGRQQGVGVRLADTSVSREHADIKIQNGDFYINDLASKFGSMVYIPNSFEIAPKPGCHIFQSAQSRIRIKIAENDKQMDQLNDRDYLSKLDSQKTEPGVMSQFSTFQETPELNQISPTRKR